MSIRMAMRKGITASVKTEAKTNADSREYAKAPPNGAHKEDKTFMEDVLRPTACKKRIKIAEVNSAINSDGWCIYGSASKTKSAQGCQSHLTSEFRLASSRYTNSKHWPKLKCEFRSMQSLIPDWPGA